jgi:hypothetical protein
MWSDICSTYGVFDKSLKKMSPNHASVTKFGITWQAFSILRVLQPVFLSKEYSAQLSSTCSILHENKSLTINRFQYIQVLSDECSTAMLKQLPEAFKDTETYTELAGKSTKKGFPNKAQIRQLFSSELLRFLLKAYTMPEPVDAINLNRIADAIDNASYKPDILKNIWSHLATDETSTWIQLIDKALFYYVEYLVDFCRVNTFRKTGIPFIDILAKKKALLCESLCFDDTARIEYRNFLQDPSKKKYGTKDRYQYAIKTGIFESSTQANSDKEPDIDPNQNGGKKALVSVPISFKACMKQIAFQAAYLEIDATATGHRDWWNMFDMSAFVKIIESKASNAIKTRHANLENEETKDNNEDVEILGGQPRKRLLEDLMTSFDNKSKKHKKEIFQRTLKMVADSFKDEEDSSTEETEISRNEATVYKGLFAPINTKQDKIDNRSDLSSDDNDKSDTSEPDNF